MENVTEITAVHFQLKFLLFLSVSMRKYRLGTEGACIYIMCECKLCPDAVYCTPVLWIND